MTDRAYNVRRSDETRQPTGWANYRGNVLAGVTRDIDSGRPKGPNYMGELMWPVEATYDPETDKTRVGFSYMAPELMGATS